MTKVNIAMSRWL